MPHYWNARESKWPHRSRSKVFSANYPFITNHIFNKILNELFVWRLHITKLSMIMRSEATNNPAVYLIALAVKNLHSEFTLTFHTSLLSALALAKVELTPSCGGTGVHVLKLQPGIDH